MSDTVKIFQQLLPKVVTEKETISKDLALEIWNAIKVYPSIQAYQEANSGVYNYADLRDVFKCAKKVALDIDSFLNGTTVKKDATFDEEGKELTAVVYFDPDKDKLAYRDLWRKDNPDSLLDIAMMFLDYKSSQ